MELEGKKGLFVEEVKAHVQCSNVSPCWSVLTRFWAKKGWFGAQNV